MASGHFVVASPKKVADHYYTFTNMPPIHGSSAKQLKVTKWDQFGDPITSYYMAFNYRLAANACGCPAYRVCKHTKAVYGLWQENRLAEIQKLRWDEVDGWQENKDVLDDLFG
jgi:hypothetical protein